MSDSLYRTSDTVIALTSLCLLLCSVSVSVSLARPPGLLPRRPAEDAARSGTARREEAGGAAAAEERGETETRRLCLPPTSMRRWMITTTPNEAFRNS